MTKPYRICTRCIMDTTDPDIVFDADGYCNHCTAYLVAAGGVQPAARGARAAARRSRGRNEAQRARQEYDCIIGVSGGVDSSFLAIKVKELGLRPLAVHVDNGWNSDKAVETSSAFSIRCTSTCRRMC